MLTIFLLSILTLATVLKAVFYRREQERLNDIRRALRTTSDVVRALALHHAQGNKELQVTLTDVFQTNGTRCADCPLRNSTFCEDCGRWASGAGRDERGR